MSDQLGWCVGGGRHGDGHWTAAAQAQPGDGDMSVTAATSTEPGGPGLDVAAALEDRVGVITSIDPR